MSVKVVSDSEIVVDGSASDLSVYQEIKNEYALLISRGAKSINVKLNGTMAMSSALIGFFIKTINVDKVTLNLYVSDERVYELLDMLHLIQLFNVKRL